MKTFLLRHQRKILLGFIFFILLSIPFFWIVTRGGDDGKFYYLFPGQFLLHFAPGNIFNDLGSFNPQQYIMPFALLLLVFKKIFFFLDVQKLFFGLNLACGFLFFYFFLGLFDRDDTGAAARITAALFYSLSIFAYYTLWVSQLFSLYLVSVFPLILYLFFKSVQEKKIRYTVWAALLTSLFSMLALSVPWLMALVIAILPLTAQFFWEHKKVFAKFLLVFLALSLLVNAYWIFGYVLSWGQGGAVSNVVSTDFRKENNSLIHAVSDHNSVLYPLFDLYHKNLQIDYNWTTKDIYTDYLLKLLPLNFLFLLVIILPVFFYRRANRRDAKLYTAALISWLVVLFLYTVNIGPWGSPLFIWLTNNVPGFVMFRNMYDKLGIALAFSYALILFISLKIIGGGMGLKPFQKGIVCFPLILVILLNSYPLVSGAFYHLPIQSTKDTYARISNFNDDFYSLTDYIAAMDTSSKFLWLPLNQAGYIVVSDKYHPNYYYTGISLLKTLSDKNDYSGILNFNGYSDFIQQNIAKKNYDGVFALLSKFNIGYVIVNKDISTDLQHSALYGYLAPGDLYDNQMSPEFLNGILGEKVRDFGDRYSLYKINDAYLSKVLKADHLAFYKINDNEYHLYFKNLVVPESLYFLSSYNSFWNLYPGTGAAINNIYKKPVFSQTHVRDFGYANRWQIDPAYIKQNIDPKNYTVNPDGSINMELTLYFAPQGYFLAGILISMLALAGSVMFSAWDYIHNRRKP